ncbi:MAG: hypothetical protein LBE62_03285 [Azonexus sp.]|jgi:hypothetical protein|nr:hypothetical protein [Azonexus sp.]
MWLTLRQRLLPLDTLYVQIFSDRLVAANITTGQSATTRRDPQYASPRLLVGHFTSAEQQLKTTVKPLRHPLRAHEILVHPMEQIEGGLSQIEDRIFRELGKSTGACRVGVHTGNILNGQAISRAIADYQLRPPS